MGLCSSTTINKTEIPEPTAQEKAMMDMMTNNLMPAALEAQGYEVIKSQGTYEETGEYERFTEKRTRFTKERTELEEQLATLQGGAFTGSKQNEMAMLQSQISQINRQLDTVDKEEDDFLEDYDPQMTYKTRRLDSPEVERARTLAGDNWATDPTYLALKEEYEEEKVAKGKQRSEIEQKFMDVTEKFLDGDYSITKEQGELLKKNMAPIRAAVTDMFTKAREESEGTEKDLLSTLNETFTEFDKRVESTHLSTMDALDVVGDQILKTGSDMEAALENTVSIQKELMEMGIEDYSGKVLKQVAGNAAMLGRSPDDPEYTQEIAKTIAREVKSGMLNLGAMEAQGVLSIKERTGGALEQLGMTRAELVSQRGQKLEGSALDRGGQKMNIEGRYGDQATQMRMQEGQANVGLEEQAANMRWQVGAGMAPQQASLGMGVSQYQNALEQQGIANAKGAMMTPMPMVDYQARERHAQPTTTTTKSPSVLGSVFGAITGAVGAGASIFGGMGAAKGMRSMGSMYQGGFSGQGASNVFGQTGGYYGGR